MGTTWPHPPRSTDRVTIIIPIRIFGSDVHGRAFSDEAETVEVSRNGAMILTGRNMAPLEEFLIRVKRTGQESPAQIVGQVRKQPDRFVYGAKLLDPSVDLWNINFVPLSESERAVGRILLECSKCLLREVIYLEEFETEVYHANRHIYHHCTRCRESVIWNEAANEPTERASAIPSPAPAAPQQPMPRTSNERRHTRVACKLRACIRYRQCDEEEVLEVNDVSRGGACFTIRKYLAPGTKMEIAVPYSPGMANIFIPAQIVRLKAIPDKNYYQCGAAFIKR